jgi:endonuclease/exonuclease/phosphatase family metal-dependent hydrolase
MNPESESPSLPIATYNICQGGYHRHCDRGIPPRFGLINEGVRKLESSIVGLVDTNGWMDLYTNFEIALLLNHKYAKSILLNDIHGKPYDKRVGLTVASDIPMTCETIRIHDRNALVTTVVFNGRPVEIATVYLRFPEDGGKINELRMRQTEELVRQLKQSSNDQIVMGDLNTIPDQENQVMRQFLNFVFRNFPALIPKMIRYQSDVIHSGPLEVLKQSGFTDAENDHQHHPTFPTKLLNWPVPGPFMCLDYIFTRGENIKVIDISSPKGVIYDYASDHFPKKGRIVTNPTA